MDLPKGPENVTKWHGLLHGKSKLFCQREAAVSQAMKDLPFLWLAKDPLLSHQDNGTYVSHIVFHPSIFSSMYGHEHHFQKSQIHKLQVTSKMPTQRECKLCPNFICGDMRLPHFKTSRKAGIGRWSLPPGPWIFLLAQSFAPKLRIPSSWMNLSKAHGFGSTFAPMSPLHHMSRVQIRCMGLCIEDNLCGPLLCHNIPGFSKVLCVMGPPDLAKLILHCIEHKNKFPRSWMLRFASHASFVAALATLATSGCCVRFGLDFSILLKRRQHLFAAPATFPTDFSKVLCSKIKTNGNWRVNLSWSSQLVCWLIQ